MRIRILGSIAAALLVAGASGCGGDSVDCSEDQVEVAYLGTSNDRVECHPIPAVCGGTAACAVQDCIAAMYGLCQSPAIGVGCSDTFPPTIISCNE
jgi:hypothetical protein